jgi:hypothetical protein
MNSPFDDQNATFLVANQRQRKRVQPTRRRGGQEAARKLTYLFPQHCSVLLPFLRRNKSRIAP